MRIYFDCCCYNRPFDDLSQERVKMEADAILAIATRALSSDDIILGSAALTLEIAAISDKARISKVAELYKIATEYISLDNTVKNQARQLQKYGLHDMDSAHVALAEKGHADIFLTVDDKLLKMCQRLELHMRTMNPLEYIREVLQNESKY